MPDMICTGADVVSLTKRLAMPALFVMTFIKRNMTYGSIRYSENEWNEMQHRL